MLELGQIALPLILLYYALLFAWTFARPSPEVLQAVQGYTLLHTDQNGWVHLSTDGKNLWVENQRL
jgi:hypothetical protein